LTALGASSSFDTRRDGKVASLVVYEAGQISAALGFRGRHAALAAA
jgi:hypothetical protein